MATGIICVILIVLCIYGIKSYAGRLAHGCCGGGGSSMKRERPADRNREHYPVRVRLTVDGMSCKNCGIRVENVFHSVKTEDGKELFLAQADWKKKTVLVWMRERVSDERLSRLVKNAGYTLVRVDEL